MDPNSNAAMPEQPPAPPAAPPQPGANPAPAVPQTPIPSASAQPSPPAAQPPEEPPKPKGGMGKIIKVLAIILLLGALAAAGVVGYTMLNQGQPEEVIEADPNEYVFEEFPDFAGIPINDNTISFAKVDGKFCLRYKGRIYTPQDTGSLTPRYKEETEAMKSFPWKGLTDAPEDIVIRGGPGDDIFSFKESPSNRSFVFIARWQFEDGERYYMYRFHNNNFSQLRVFGRADGLFHVPKINLFSLGGNFLNISLFRCDACLGEVPDTLLYYIPTGETKRLGQLSFFEWGEDDNVYRYKDYRDGVDPADLPLRVNEFFEESVELLIP